MEKRTIDLSKLIGIPYNRMDCFDLIKKFYKQYFDSEVFSSISTAEENWERDVLIKANKGKFKQVSSPKFGDVIVIKIHGFECHLGIYADNGQFIHTTKTTGSCIDRIGRWHKLITGYYRLEEDKNGYQD